MMQIVRRPRSARTSLLPWLLPVAALTLAPVAGAQTTPRTCADLAAVDGAPSADLYCIDLVPAPDFPGAHGVVELGRAPSPFGVAVTRDGTHVFDLTVRVSGLPDPAGFDGAVAFVAWVTTPMLAPMVRLGEVGDGRVARGRVAFDKFLVLITAEPVTEVAHVGEGEERRGRIVLRGTSPSMRMIPHDEPYLLVADDDAHAHGAEHGGSGDHPHAEPPASPAPLEWRMPPMHPRVPMGPGMGHLRPSVRPFLPAAAPGERVVDGRPSEVIRVADGDTIELTAQRVRRLLDGVPVIMYGYNGQVPGPLIRAAEGATITVRLHNRTEFPTAVHWHGIRLDNRFDGVPGVTQAAVPPGGSFTYEVKLPDAGLYWYHPHLREDVKQALGLYGNIRVDGRGIDSRNEVHREEVWMLDDLLVDEHGLVPFGLEAPTHALMGRFGNVLLVNGALSTRLDVDRGEVVRFLLTNVASARTFNLSFGGAPIRLVSSDLSRFEREEWVESVVIAPAERYVVEVRFEQAGTVAVENRVRAIDHVYGNYFQEVDTLALVHVRERAAPALASPFDRLGGDPRVSAEIASLRPHFDRTPDHELVLTQEVRDLPFPLRPLMQLDSAFFNPVEWSSTMPMMDWAVTGNEVTWILRDPATGRENMEIDWRFRVGDLVRLRIRNERQLLHAMHHPIHLHGQRFLVLALNGVPNENLVWKDTFLLPVGWTAELLVEMSNPGDWMVHCHISEHLETGMMAVFRVDPQVGEWKGWDGYTPGEAHH
jgi:suppressor of ftsI